jgi:hypothetical protein
LGLLVAVALVATAVMIVRSGKPGASQTQLDWSVAGPAIARHAEWGVRALIAEEGGGLREVWAPVRPAPPSSLAQTAASVIHLGVTALVPTGGAPVAAIGVTSPPDQAVIDLRLWRYVNRLPVRIESLDLPGPAPGVERLLVPPAGLSLGGRWPSGSYELELLVGSRVMRVTASFPQTRNDPMTLQLVSGLAASLPSGPFTISSDADGTMRLGHLDVVPGTQLAPGIAWLQAVPGLDAPLVATVPSDLPVRALGIRGDPGEQLVSALLFDLSPTPLATRTTAASRLAAPAGDIGMFDPASGSITPGLYRIDSTWQSGDYLLARSWHLDVRASGASAEYTPPLLAAAREFSAMAGSWAVLTVGAQPQPQMPGAAGTYLEALGDTCSQGSMVPPGQPIVGVGHPRPRADRVVVERLLAGGARTPGDVAISIDPAPGLVLLAAQSPTGFDPGAWLVTIDHGGVADTVVFCVPAA